MESVQRPEPHAEKLVLGLVRGDEVANFRSYTRQMISIQASPEAGLATQ